MTTKTLTHNYYHGYTVAPAVTALYNYAYVLGGVGAATAFQDGGAGQVALTSAYGASVQNHDVIGGGAGGAGSVGRASTSLSVHGFNGYRGGAGGIGAWLPSGGSFSNASRVIGGAGGAGGGGGLGYGSVFNGYSRNGVGGHGGTGGVGLQISKGSVVNQAGATIVGGAGGAGGAGVSGGGFLSIYSYDGSGGGDGGTGGTGVSFSGSTLTNLGSISGGAGGVGGAGGAAGYGGSAGGNGGAGSAGDGVDLFGAARLINGSAADTAAAIRGYYGVYQAGAVSTVTNYGAITGIMSVGVEQARVGDVLLNKASGVVSGYLYGVAGTAPATVMNYGVLRSTGGNAGAAGASPNGGVVVNGSAGDTTALIEGVNGVIDPGSTGVTLTNFGTIQGTTAAVTFSSAYDRLIAESSSTFIGAVRGGGGTLELASGVGGITGLGGAGSIIGAEALTFSGFGAYVLDAGSHWTISGTNTDPGASLWVAGGMSNTGQLDIHVAVIGGAAINLSTISQGVTLAGGTLTNGGPSKLAALISGADYGVYVDDASSSPSTVVNYGTVTGGSGGGNDSGALFNGAGQITNGSATDHSALIQGSLGVFLFAADSTVTNFATIDGSSGLGVVLYYSTSRLIVEAGSTIIGAAKGAGGTLELAGGSGTLTGLGATGTISVAAAATFSGFGSYVIDSGGAWTLTGANTIAKAATLTNNATVTVAGSLVNKGSIGGGATARLNVAGSLSNTGVVGNRVFDEGGAISNQGTIGSVGSGVHIDAGKLTNGGPAVLTALVIGGAYGVYAGSAAPATVVNYATITSTGAGSQAWGVWLHGGAVTNGHASDLTALMKGVGGVYLEGAATLTNYGSIFGTGGVSVRMINAADRLIAEAGSTFVGKVMGGGGVLELAGGTGTITGLGGAGSISGAEAMTFGGFGSYATDAGGTWTLAGTDALAHGQTLSTGGAVTLTGSLDNHGLVTGGSPAALALAGGAQLTNEADGAINGIGKGVGVSLHGASTLTNRGAISGQSGLYEYTGATVTNLGTIGGGVDGVGLFGGGVTNGGATNHAALITGAQDGIAGGAGGGATVVNFATIKGDSGDAVRLLAAGDRLIAEAGSSLIGQAAGGGGTLELAGGTGTIANLGGAGTVTGGMAMTFGGFGTYVLDAGSTWTLAGSANLAAGQTLVNQGVVTDADGLTVAGSLTNDGQIGGALATDGGVITNLGTLSNGAGMQGGRLTNGSASVTTALISAGAYAIYANTAGPATVTNFGTIVQVGGGGDNAGVWLNGGGAIANGSTTDTAALIEGFTGVQTFGSTITVSNFGTIEGTGGVAVDFSSSADRLIAEAGSTFIGAVRGGGGTLELADGIGALSGLGTAFTGFGQYQVDSGGIWTLANANTLAAGATLTNAGALTVTGSLANLGDIAGEVDSYGGTITNGTAKKKTASITGADGVKSGSSGLRLTNFGLIKGTATGDLNAGVYIYAGSVTNGAVTDTSALITGESGVYDYGSGVTVANFGSIIGAPNVGVRMQNGGVLANGSAKDITALVSGFDGFYANEPSTVTNFGTITGALAGVRLDGGALINGSATDAKAAITGGADGVYAGYDAATTVTNFGSIMGPVSVVFKNAADRLIAEAGSSLVGQAAGGGGSLELASGAGTITGMGGAGTITGDRSMSFGAFGSYLLDTGSSWTFAGTNTLAAGQILTNGGSVRVTGAVNAGAATVNNFGAIAVMGGAALKFLAGGRLIERAGATFTGAVQGGGGTLELAAGTGQFAGLGTGFGSVVIDAGGVWTVSGVNTLATGATFTDAGTLILTAALGGAGSLSLTGGTMTVRAGGALTLAKVSQTGGTSVAAFATSETFAGLWTQTAGTLSVGSGDTLTLTGKADTFAGTIGGGGRVSFAGGASTLNAGARLTVLALGLTNSGSKLTLATSLSYGGAFTQGPGATLALGANALTLTKSAMLSGAVTGTGGSLIFKGGTETLGTGASFAMSNWTIGGGAAVTIDVSLNYGHAFTQSASTLTLAAGNTLSLQAASFTGATINGGTLGTAGATSLKGVTLGHVAWINSGVATQTVTTTLGDATAGASVVTNTAGGVIDFTTDTGIAVAGDGGTVVNNGLIEKTAGAKTSLIAAAVANGPGGIIMVDRGVLEFTAAVTGGKAVIAGGTLKLDAAFNRAVAFTGAAGVLDLAQSQAFRAAISGFSTTGGTALELRDIAFNTGTTKASYAGTTTTGTLTVTDGTHTASIKLIGDYTHAVWRLSAATGGGTKVIDPTAAALAFVQAAAALATAPGASGSGGDVRPSPTPVLVAPHAPHG